LSDARASLDRALTNQNTGERVREFGRVFALLVQRDPEAALAYVRTMPRGIERTSGLLMALDAISRTNLDRALALARELATGHDESDIYSVLFDRLARANVPTAVAQLTQVPAGEPRDKALRALTDLWARTDAPAAVKWAQSLPDPADRAPALETALYNLATRDPLQTIELAQKNLTGAALDRLVLIALDKLTETDPQGASGLVALLPPGETQNHAAIGVARALAAQNPQNALAWAGTLKDNTARWVASTNVYTVWAKADSTAAGAYVLALPAGRDQHDAAVHLAGMLVETTTPARAIAWAQSLPAAETRPVALTTIANEWARHDGPAATQWAAAQPAGAVLPAAVTGAFSYWLLQDAGGARAWLANASLPPDLKAKLQAGAR
jgi:hypothetical protein